MSFHHFSLSFTVFTPPLRQVSSTSYHLQYLNLSQGYSFLPFLSISYPNLNQGLFDEKLHQVSTMAPNISKYQPGPLHQISFHWIPMATPQPPLHGHQVRVSSKWPCEWTSTTWWSTTWSSVPSWCPGWSSWRWPWRPPRNSSDMACASRMCALESPWRFWGPGGWWKSMDFIGIL